MTINVETRLTFPEAFRANFILVRWMPKLAISYLFLFLFGIALLVWNVKTSESVTFFDVSPCIFVSASPIFVVMLSAWRMRAYWRKHGGTVLQFSDSGIEATTGLYNATILWAAVERVRSTKEFVFVFTSAQAILMVPRRALSASDEPAFLAMTTSRA